MSFDQSLMHLYATQLITYEEALRQSSNPDDFSLKASGVSSASAPSREAFVGASVESEAAEKREITIEIADHDRRKTRPSRAWSPAH